MTTNDAPVTFAEYGDRIAIALFQCALFDHRNGGKYAIAEMDNLRAIAREFGNAIIASEGEWTAEEWGDAVCTLMDCDQLRIHRDEILGLMQYEQNGFPD